MAAQIGIELSPVTCRIVELDGGAAWRAEGPETIVRSYAIVPMNTDEIAARLAPFGRREAAVVVWGVSCDHRQVVVKQRGYQKMRADAIAAARQAGVVTEGMLVDIAPIGVVDPNTKRRPVLIAMASSPELSTAVQPLIEAGLRIRSVVTPADALTSLARTRRVFSVPESIEAYVALEATAACVALVRDGALMASRELGWGYLDGAAGRQAPRGREDIARRLGDDLSEFLSTVGAAPGTVRQISICGALPELRSMTAPLMEQLDVEVETLDSQFGIDTTALLESGDDFRERSAELRLAWAVATDWHAPINLIRQRRRQTRKTALARAAVAAGVAAGLGLGWRVERSAWWQSTSPATRAGPPPGLSPPSPPPAKTAPMRSAPPAAPPRSTLPPVLPVTKPTLPPISRPATPLPPAPTSPPVVTRAAPPAPTTPPAAVRGATTASSTAASTTPPVVPRAAPPAPSSPPREQSVVMPPRVSAPAASARRPEASAPEASPRRAIEPRPSPAAPPSTAVTVPPARAVVPPPAPPTPPRARAIEPPLTLPAPPARSVEPPPTSPGPPPARSVEPPPARAAVPPPPAATSPAAVPSAEPKGLPLAPLPRRQPPPVRPPERPAPAPIPLDATLGSILYSPDRKLAIIDGRIVGLADEVNGARIVDITPNTVLLRDAQGRMRSLTLGTFGR